MPVLDFECQLARSQISRYMGGEILSEQLLRQLSGHVGECPGCRLFLQERRDALRQMLGTDEAISKASEEPRAGYAVVNSKLKEFVETGASAPSKSKAEALLAQIQAATAKKPSEPSKAAVPAVKASGLLTFSKPALYSVGLAAVLIIMSYVVKSPHGLLGAKALGSSQHQSSSGSDSSAKNGSTAPADSDSDTSGNSDQPDSSNKVDPKSADSGAASGVASKTAPAQNDKGSSPGNSGASATPDSSSAAAKASSGSHAAVQGGSSKPVGATQSASKLGKGKPGGLMKLPASQSRIRGNGRPLTHKVNHRWVRRRVWKRASRSAITVYPSGQ